MVAAIPSLGCLALAGCRNDAYHWIHLQRIAYCRHCAATRDNTVEILRQRVDRNLYQARLRRIHAAWLRLYGAESPWIFVFTALMVLVLLIVCERPSLELACCMYMWLGMLPVYSNVALHNFRTDSQEWCLTCPAGHCICLNRYTATIVTDTVVGLYNGIFWGVIVKHFVTKFLTNYDREPLLFLTIYIFISLCAVVLTSQCFGRIHSNAIRRGMSHGFTWSGRAVYVLLFRFQDVRNFISLFFTRVRSRHRRSLWI